VSSAPSPEEITQARSVIDRLDAAYATRVVGQESLRQSLLICLMTGGHLLIESVPGLAKTTAARTMADAVAGSFHRIQCTPDLLPSDIVGTQIYNQKDSTFHTELGPIHANFVLLDEINRANSKTQAATLEAMQERQTTIAGVIHPVPRPFTVMATQNPIESEGTYELPEAQMDRFLLKEVLTYPTPDQEVEVLEKIEAEGPNHGHAQTGADGVPRSTTGVTTDHLIWLQDLTGRVYVDRAIKDYIARLVWATRTAPQVIGNELGRFVDYGASPRGSIALMTAARALALMSGRNHVIPDDVVALRHAALRHRVLLSYEAAANGVKPEHIIDAVFTATRTP
jgi:MoxR-like ATPase